MQKTILNKSKNMQLRHADSDVQPCLHVLNGLEAGKIIHMYRQSMRIGLAQDNEVTLRGHGIDTVHARIDIVGEKSITINHCSDSYPTLVNGLSIQQTSIKKNDLIKIGGQELQFVYKSYDELSRNALALEKNMLDASGMILKKNIFYEQLKQELDFAERTKQKLTCIMLSIDCMHSQVNISQCIELIKYSSRSYDLLGKYKDNVFCMVLKNAALDNALIFTRRLQDNFEMSFKDAVHINIGMTSLKSNETIDADSMMQSAWIYLKEARKRPQETVVSPRNV